jgi:hypothetical protein
VEHGGLGGVGGDQVENIDVMGLADPTEPADPLLDLHRVPGQVEIANGVSELEVAAFAAGLGTKQQSSRPAELLDGSLFLQPRQPAVEHCDAMPGFLEPALEQLLGGSALGEDDQLVAELVEQADQPADLDAFMLRQRTLG